MPLSSQTHDRSIALQPSTEAKVYGLFALAIAFTVVGVVVGVLFASLFIRSGVQMLFLLGELVLIFTAGLWVRRSPLNLFLFVLFPLLSGITITPYLLYVLAQRADGAGILLNALIATALMTGSAAILARVVRWDLSGFGHALLMAVIGLIALSVLQIFVPALRTGMAEVLISGGGVCIFAFFTAFDIQRIQRLGRMGASPFLLALSLYLDIFNLFLYILRFMLALSGNRR